jgi:hypothetical protein
MSRLPVDESFLANTLKLAWHGKFSGKSTLKHSQKNRKKNNGPRQTNSAVKRQAWNNSVTNANYSKNYTHITGVFLQPVTFLSQPISIIWF